MQNPNTSAPVVEEQKEEEPPAMTHDVNMLEVMSELSLFKNMLLIRDCEDPKKLKGHIKYWSTKVENLTNFPI